MQEENFGRACSPLMVGGLALGLVALAGCGSASVSDPDPPPTGTDPISGTVVDHSTGQPVGGAIVLLEQRDAGGIDRAVKSTTTASDGSFVAGDLSAGNYDVVIAASVTSDSGGAVTYATTVTFGVPANTALGRIPLVPEYGDSMPNGPPAEIAATVTSVAAGGVPAAAEIKLSALQAAAPASEAPVQLPVPTFAGSTPKIITATNTGCPAGTACANYRLLVPSSPPVVGTYHSSGTSYTIPAPDPVEVVYMVEGRAFVKGSAGTPDCVPSTESAGPAVPRGTLASHITNLAFIGCQ